LETCPIDSDLVKWIAGIILVLRIVLRFPVTAAGCKRWMGKSSGKWKVESGKEIPSIKG